MNTTKYKGFREQFIECTALGFHKKTRSRPLTPEMLPLCPSKRKKFLEANIKHLKFQVCGRFGGNCSSDHPECRRLRGLI